MLVNCTKEQYLKCVDNDVVVGIVNVVVVGVVVVIVGVVVVGVVGAAVCCWLLQKSDFLVPEKKIAVVVDVASARASIAKFIKRPN